MQSEMERVREENAKLRAQAEARAAAERAQEASSVRRASVAEVGADEIAALRARVTAAEDAAERARRDAEDARARAQATTASASRRAPRKSALESLHVPLSSITIEAEDGEPRTSKPSTSTSRGATRVLPRGMSTRTALALAYVAVTHVAMFVYKHRAFECTHAGLLADATHRLP